MEKKINIAEILKDCPKGMELYSPLFGDCKFVKVHDYEAEIIVEIETGANVSFKTDGRYFDYPNAECLLFPKGKTTWEGFVPPCQFNDGDVIYTDSFIAIFSDITESGAVYYHCYYHIHTKRFKAKHDCGIGNINYDEFRIATADEKAKLFQAIKDNGYTWNEETKTLDKLMKFKDGDIIYNRLQKKICIYYLCEDEVPRIRYCRYNESNIIWQFEKLEYPIPIAVQDYRLATEKEKEKLFQAIKDNGYKWNAEIKTLEKVPKIKDGDIIYTKTSLSEWVSIFEKFDDDECKCYIDYCIDSDTYYGKIGGKKNPLCEINDIEEQRLATEEEKQKLFDVIKENGHRWNSETKTLEKLVKPKFKVGDIITKIDGSRKGEIFYIDVDKYHVAVSNDIGIDVFFEDQDEWELIPNKFDINNLKPFQKVLVRNDDSCVWKCSWYSHYSKYSYPYICTCTGYKQCIPYEQNKHLLGTTNNCDKYYKTWE